VALRPAISYALRAEASVCLSVGSVDLLCSRREIPCLRRDLHDYLVAESLLSFICTGDMLKQQTAGKQW